MADPVLHIKDSYFFEVPKFLWRHDWKSLEEVPQFLRDAHPDESLEAFNRDMAGKILIPQPFGTLKNLYEPKSGFLITRFMILELVVALFLIFMFKKLADRMQAGGPPKGRFWNAFEALLLYVRDQIARPAIGEHDGDKFVPLLWTMFFFILTLNLLGLAPWMGTATGAFGTTLALAFVTFLTGMIAGMMKLGALGYWFNLVPHMDLPWYMFPIKLAIFAIELLGLFIKHGVLGIRLLANMVAGHLVLFGILGMIATAATASTGVWVTTTTVSVIGATLFCVLELMVAFLQAYIFTFLSALFIGASIHHH